ncbi:MAG: T9SS type A sorting domain-containing protein [Microscillaceae bacterium]|nr:T9SS type A sorting domain-containing protein [Microscillaceae bacterium]
MKTVHFFRKMILRTILFCGVVLFYANSLFAQAPGTNDPSFNPGDVGFGMGDGFDRDVQALAVQPDGKILAAGYFTSYNGINCNSVIRLNVDGSLDTNFNSALSSGSYANSLAIQPDGKILVGGIFWSIHGISFYGVTRLDTDGSLDTTFIFNTYASISSIAVQPDGKIIVAGLLYSYNNIAQNGIARLNSDGSLDQSFDPGSGPLYSNSVNTIVLQSDGKMIIGGSFTSFNGSVVNKIARLNPDGSVDKNFNTEGEFGDSYFTEVNTLILQTDGKVLAGGQFKSYQGVSRNNIIRLNIDGSLDQSFDPGIGFDSTVTSLNLYSDGRILAAGRFSNYNGTSRGRIARLNSNGTLDDSFNPESGFDYPVNTTILQQDDKILAAGNFKSYNGIVRTRIAYLKDDGSLNLQIFNEGISVMGFNNYVYCTATQSDGKILVGGQFSSYNGIVRVGIARLNKNGSLDMSFDPKKGFNFFEQTGSVYSIFPLEDGKILVGGVFTNYDGIMSKGIARLNADGSFDDSFGTDEKLSGVGIPGAKSFAIQSDGKILIGGFFKSYKGVARKGILRLNVDGSLDSSFDPGTGFGDGIGFGNGSYISSDITNIIPLEDGKILVGGFFTSYNGTVRNGIIRLHANGSLDTSFDPNNGFSSDFSDSTPYIQALAVLPNKKILVGGDFKSYQGDTHNRIIRLNDDGSIDQSFNSGAGFDAAVRAFAIQPNGKIIVAGYFNTYDGIPSGNIVRLNPDGSIDNGFNSGSGFNALKDYYDAVFSLILQPDGKIVVGGGFTSYNGVGRNRIARLFGGEVISVDSLILVNADTDQDIMPLSEGAVINLSEIGTSNLSVRAVGSNNAIKSVKFNLSGAKTFSKTESMAPYTLFGDQNGGKDFFGQTFAPGQYSLTATPYNQAAAQGTAGTALSVNFSVIPGNALAVQQLILVNANTDQDISPLTEGAVIDLGQVSTNNFSIRASTLPSSVGSVYFALSGPLNITRTENVAPYALFGDQNGGKDFFGQAFAPGKYSISVTPYSGASRTGNVGTTRTIHFEVVPGNVLTVQDLILVNADTDQDLMPLSQGTVINLSEIGTANLSVRATTSPYPVGSVRFHLSGPVSENKVETAIPYALFGDLNGGKDFIGKAFTPGQYSLTVTPYAKAFGNGTVGTATTLNFSVIQSESNALLMEVIIYPNTTSDWVTISLKNATEAQLKVIDRAGQTVYEGLVQDGSQVSFAGQSTGTYQMIFQANAQTLTKQVMVVR